jgi:hypothetical protein
MTNLKLLPPTKKYKAQVIQYKQDFLNNKDSLDGCA